LFSVRLALIKFKNVKEIKAIIEGQLKSIGIIEGEQNVTGIVSMHGGSINESYRVETKEATYFLKINRRGDVRYFFDIEAKGLESLRTNSKFHIPRVLKVFSTEKFGGLLMEFVPNSIPASNFWEDFGRKLAELHKVSSNQFGLGYNNYIGSLAQSNLFKSNWVEFFREERLEKQYQLSRENQLLDNSFGMDLQRLYNKLPEIIPIEIPSLVHGDLWSGNFTVSSNGLASIFDPAVYFGHREADIAMMHLFGGFDKQLFQAYHEAYPLGHGWEERIDLFNLYPLMVHVNLFGGSYVSRLKQVLKKYL
jgi:fructosamine-3-kinase